MQVSALNPASPEAAQIRHLFVVTLWVCVFILFVVVAALTYILLRYARRMPDQAPGQFGNKKLEITWTVIPLLVVCWLFALSLLTARSVDRYTDERSTGRKPDIIVTGHQWWWEFQYPNSGVVTANELHVPTGRDLVLQIDTADVVHDFWVPELARKIDAVPDWHNYINMRPERIGVYRGFCAEFCGAQHAWMQFRVISEAPRQFESWLQGQRQKAPAAAVSATGVSSDAARASERFRALTCANCHVVNGVTANLHAGRVGPDLTHLGSRQTLAGYRIANTRENLGRWLEDPQAIKPGCFMPNLKLSKSDVAMLATWLESLR